ncbi:MAG: hypothetical protein WC609_03700 [Candidatus Paceibacterota bacterium]|jgi:hypothetical protein
MEESKQNKIVLLRQMIENAERNIAGAKQILQQLDAGNSRRVQSDSMASQIIEGAFDGEKMIGMDGKKYPVPVNYASKSKLVEGDLLKLTITDDGSFVYKQISPIERRKIIGTVMKDSKGKYYILAEQKKYKVLLASVTYFKAKEGDEVILVVPKERVSKWGAIEALMDESSADAEELAQDEEDEDENSGRQARKEADLDEENSTQDLIEDEWTPDIDEIKKEAKFQDEEKEEIFDDLSG